MSPCALRVISLPRSSCDAFGLKRTLYMAVPVFEAVGENAGAATISILRNQEKRRTGPKVSDGGALRGHAGAV
jgi:hypothetical protein